MINSNDVMSEIDNLAVSNSYLCTLENCVNLIEQHKSPLNILHLNIRSINKNFYELLTILSQHKLEYDIIALTECWLEANTNSIIPQINGYETHSSKIHSNQNDGLVIYIKENLKCCVSEPLFVEGSCMTVKLGLDMVFVFIYRSPSYKNTDQFIASLDTVLNNLKSYKTLAIVGDLNINIINDKQDSHSDNYLNLTASHGLLPAHLYPTREESCLDHVILRSPISSITMVIETSITDHAPVLLSIDCAKTKTATGKYKTCIDYEAIQRDLLACDFSNVTDTSDVNIATNNLISIISNVVEQNTKYSIVPTKYRLLKPWMTAGLLRCLKNRDNMHSKLKKTPDDIILSITYKRYRNFCTNLLRKIKTNYEKNELARTKHNCKALWKTIKSIANLKKTLKSSKELLKCCSDPSLSINAVNQFFAHVGENLASKIPNLGKFKDPPSCCSPKDSLVILKSDYSDIETQILNLRDDCAVGWDKISARIIKASRATLVPPIAYICNLAVDSGVFPDAFKKAIVHPIHKAGDRGSVDNYRPISVLPALSKILERILNNTLVNYMNKNSIISDKQFGFRSGRSTEDAVIALTSSIVQHIDKKRKCLAVFLDLSKAFDSVSIPLLVEKIEQAGVRGVDIYCDYLNGRKQVSQIESLTSDEEGISYGVPQGSILGPTLFQLYINQLCNLQLSNSEIFTYADDTAIVIHGTDWSELKESAEISLRRVQQWLSTNLLTLNIKKTQYVAFALLNSQQPPPNYSIIAHTCNNGTLCSCIPITKVTSAKYLGVYIDEKLKWHAHIEALTNRVRKLIAIFKNLRRSADFSTLKMVYFALVESNLTYCISAWGGAGKTLLLKLERAQRALLKVLMFKPFRYPTAALYSECGVLSVRKLYIQKTVLRKHKSITAEHLAAISNSRIGKNVFPTVKHRLKFSSQNYDIQGSRLYNKINKLINIYHTNNFECKRKVTTLLLTLTYEEIEDLLKTLL